MVEKNMVSKKNKRKIAYEGTNYYWYVRVDEHGHRVHIISDDKKVHLEYPFFDTEIPVAPQDIRDHLNNIMPISYRVHCYPKST